MKRALVVVVLFAAGAFVAVIQFHRSSAQAVSSAWGTALAVQQLTPAPRPVPSQPMHQNALRCLDSMLKVSPQPFGPFTASGRAALEPELRGESPLSDATQTELQRLHGWFQGLRECAEAAQTRLDSDLFVWRVADGSLERAVEAMTLGSVLELRAQLAAGDLGSVGETCSQVLALGAELSHLGAHGARPSLRLLTGVAPVCTEALARVKPEERKTFSEAWATIAPRLATRAAFAQLEHVRQPALLFAWTVDAGSPFPGSEPWKAQSAWASWDGAFTAWQAALENPADRAKAWTTLQPLMSDDLEAALAALDDAHRLVTVLLSLAMGDETARPGVERDVAAHRVTFASTLGPVVLALP